MFKRISQDEWAAIVPIISFAVIFTIFVFATIRALRMASKDRERLSSLPLDSPDTN
jgi:preprotein translocase subunit YajC